MVSPDPLGLFEAARQAVLTADWQRLASLCDQASLEAFADGVRRQFAAPQPDAARMIEGYLREYPDVPRGEAERRVTSSLGPLDPRARLELDFPSIDSLEALWRLTPLEIFAAWCEGQSPQRQMAQAVHSTESGEQHRAPLPDLKKLFNFDVLGVVSDGDSVAHVVYRDRAYVDIRADSAGTQVASGIDLEELEARAHLSTLLCHRLPTGEWRILARAGLLGIGTMMYYFGACTEDEDAA
jgi:hypothetical protein